MEKLTSLGGSGVGDSVRQRLEKLSPGRGALRGKMSAHGMVCHLSDSFRLALGLKTASHATGLLQRSLMKYFALYVPLPWPKGVGTRPEMEQGKGGTVPGEFAADIAELMRLMRQFTERTEFVAAHPIFGTMTRAQWLRWGYLHMDHHLRQFGV